MVGLFPSGLYLVSNSCLVSNLRLSCLGLSLGFSFAWFLSPFSVASAEWKLRRSDRKLAEGFLVPLYRSPRKQEPWQRFLRLFPLPKNEAFLKRLLLAKIKASKTPLASRPWRILYARLLLEGAHWGLAYGALSDLEREASLGAFGLRWRLRCLGHLGEIQNSLALVRSSLPSLPSKARFSFAFERLRLALHLRDPEEIEAALLFLTSLSLPASSRLRIAALLRDSKQAKLALSWYQGILSLSPSPPPALRFAVLGSMARLHLSDDLPSPDLKRLQRLLADLRLFEQAPLASLLTSADRLELLSLHLAFHRREKTLAAFLTSRLGSTAEAPRSKRLLSLSEGRLLLRAALDVSHKAAILHFGPMILRIDPRDLEAQIALLSAFLQREKFEEADVGMQRLLAQKQATPAHLLFFTKEGLRQTGLPPLLAWRGSWALQSQILPCPLGGAWDSLAILSYRKPTLECFRADRATWEEYRTRRWGFWERYEATPQTKARSQKAKKLLLRGVQRFASDLPFLLEAEEILDSYAAREEAARLRSLAIRSLRWLTPSERLFQTLHLRVDAASWKAIWGVLLSSPLPSFEAASPWLLAYDEFLRFQASLPTALFFPFSYTPRSARSFEIACRSLRPLLSRIAAKSPVPPPSASVFAALQSRCAIPATPP